MTWKDTCASQLDKNLKFIDSMQFLGTGLEKLVDNVIRCGSCENCKPDKCSRIVERSENVKKHVESYPCLKCENCKKVGKECIKSNHKLLKNTSEVFKGKALYVMSRKGVYPYNYVDSHEKFEEKELPKREKFYNSLNNHPISEEDYKHAIKVFKGFKLKNIGEYHDLYLTSDVLLLSEVFENFRTIATKSYGLDPLHYISLPSYSWDAMLKLTGVELELMNDIDMYQLIERGMRGGVSLYISPI